MDRYLLSVVIPTKNRQSYCLEAVRQILKIGDRRIQIVVQDNSSGDDLRQKMALLGSGRIRYHYSEKPLSFVDNFSEAVLFSDGEYLIFIGDDDGVMPYIADVAEFMRAMELDALIPGLNAVYFWPFERCEIRDGAGGALNISCPDYTGGRADSLRGLMQLMENGGQEYQSLELPRLYHGIVSRTALDLVKAKTGVYFGGLSPDIYIASALALCCRQVWRVSFPVTISGICPASGSADSAAGRHTGLLDEAPHFRGHRYYQWSDRVPALYSVETIWADSALHALSDMHRDDIAGSFHTAALDLKCRLRYPLYSGIIVEHLKKSGVGIFSLARAGCRLAGKFLWKCFRRLFRKRGTVRKLRGVTDIDEAVRLTMEQVEPEKINRFLIGEAVRLTKERIETEGHWLFEGHKFISPPD